MQGVFTFRKRDFLAVIFISQLCVRSQVIGPDLSGGAWQSLSAGNVLEASTQKRIFQWVTDQNCDILIPMNKPSRTILPKLDESLLDNIPTFGGLDVSRIRQILEQATACRYEAGVAVFEEGMPAERFYMLLDGYVRVMRMSAAGDQVTLHYIPSGEMFGIARAFRFDRYPATAVTAVQSVGLSWPMPLWDAFVAQYKGFTAETLGIIGRRIIEKDDRIMELTSQQVQQRVANALLRLVTQTGRKVEGGIVIDFPITRRDISEMTATTMHTVSRLLSAWERQGILDSERRQIKVCDPHRLTKLANPRT